MDLFEEEQQRPLPITLPEADLLFYRHIALGDDQILLQKLIDHTPWQQEHITLYGTTHPLPRLVAWFGDAGASYTYSGIRHDPAPWNDELQRLRNIVQAKCDYAFNSVLLNYYRDHRDSMGLHADDEPELGPQPVIASLSLGEERSLYFKHKSRRDLKGLTLPLPSSSLLIMRGETQINWLHGMRKISKPCGARLNLTFRRILSIDERQ